MGTGIFSIGVSGLAAAQLGLMTTEHNVVNANTPGYSRQQTVQATNIAINTGSGSVGQGVHVQTITRMYDQYITQQVNSAQTNVGQLNTYNTLSGQIDGLVADSSAGLSPALQSFFTGVQQVAANPSSLPARQLMVSSAQTLTNSFQTLSGQLSSLYGQVNSQISGTVSQINTLASEIANVNQQIVVAQSSYSQPPNDLLDQRDQMINSLNKLVGVSTTTNSDGSYNVFIGSGQQLVVGSTVQQMTAQASSADPTRIDVGLQTSAGSQELPDYLITGGQLGGLLSARSTSLDPVANQLGQVAASVALTVNGQHALGQNMLGEAQGDTGFVGNFFTLTNPQVLSNTHNTGTGALSVNFASPAAPSSPSFSGNFSTSLVPSNYQVQFGAAGNFTVTRLSDNQQVASGSGVGSVSFDGLTLNISAIGNNGDKFQIEPYSGIAQNIGVNSQIAADPRLINAAAPVAVTQNAANTGSMVISQGVVGVGYTAPTAAAPISLALTQTALQGVPGNWTAVYSDGSQVTNTGNINLTNGTATLASFTFNNMSFSVSGNPPAAGTDGFVIQRNTGGVQDSRNAVLLANLQTQNTTSGGSATYQAVYAQMVADNGVRTQQATAQLAAQTSVLNQAQATQSSLSGVNLDEEAANLLKYQQAYQASSKIIEVASKLFDTILAIG